MIKLHKLMMETQAETHTVLAKTTKATYRELATLQKEFEQARHDFQHRLEADIAASSKRAASYLEKLTNGIGTVLDSVLSKVNGAHDAIDSRSASVLTVSVHPLINTYLLRLRRIWTAPTLRREISNTTSAQSLVTSSRVAQSSPISRHRNGRQVKAQPAIFLPL